MISINKFLKNLELIYGPYSYEIFYFFEDNTFIVQWENLSQIHKLTFKRKLFNWRAYTADIEIIDKSKL